MIDAEMHDAVMALPPDERRDREKVKRSGARRLAAWPAAAGGSAYGVPKATE
jgi:hypothetical protein